MSLSDLVTALENLTWDDEAATGQFKEDFTEKKIKQIICSVNDNDWESIQRILVACPRHGDRTPMDCACAVLDRKNILDWKKHSSLRTRIFTVLSTEVVDWDTRDGFYTNFVEKFVKILKTQRLISEHKDDMTKLMTKVYSHRKCPLHFAIIDISKSFPWEEDESYVISMLDTLYTSLHSWPDISEDETCAYFAFQIIFMQIIQRGTLSDNVVKSLAHVMEFCVDQEWTSESDEHTLSWLLLKTGLDFVTMKLYNMSADVMEPMIQVAKKLLDCSDEDLQNNAMSIMSSATRIMCLKSAPLQDDNNEIVIQMYLTGQNNSVAAQFHLMYPRCPEVFHAHLDEILESLPSLESNMKICIILLLCEIAKKHPEVLKKDAIQLIIDALEDFSTRAMCLLSLISLVDKRIDDISQYEGVIIKVIQADDIAAFHGCHIIAKMSSISKDHARRYMKIILDTVNTINPQYRPQIMGYCRMIAENYVDVLVEQKDEIIKLLSYSDLKDICHRLLDMMEGRSLATVANEVADQKEGLDHMDERVAVTEENVGNLGQTVENHGEQLDKVTGDVIQQQARVDDLEQTVQETTGRVEELEHRTLSHAPEWSLDVCKLLNPKSDHDWRLLASRLGYNNDDILNWATQADPCMSMLDEWFSSQKTREATHAVLTNLQEMNRDDTATIVKEALEAVDDVIADAPDDYTHPPPVFISYQWGIQQEVRLLKKHLGMAGYQAWMDIGQMGGGDKLYEKIDTGIRAAQVVICCVTDKYALSPNCNREVALCVNLGKPIIPLLMESMSWPPTGAMGPIFGEYLYIAFQNELQIKEGKDNPFWKEAKFQELLMQLRYSIPPDQSIVTDPYKGWWDPPEEEIIIKHKKRTEKAAENMTLQKTGYDQTPDVFISYQWDKQPQIKALYRRLTGLGYHCWLDIMQMGGGDSLYDKIDRGVRGCHLVLSCVTSRYAMSANCRREVSLADTIRKPIIPLLMEDIKWPPEGPMSMVFTQMLYVSFCHPGPEVQDHWKCPAFDELLCKIEKHAPNTLCNNTIVQESKNKDAEKVEQGKSPDSLTQRSKSSASLKREVKFTSITCSIS